MTATANRVMAMDPAPPRPADTLAGLSDQANLVLRESWIWVSQNALRIVVAAAVGTLIVMALLGVKALGRRLCRGEGVPSLRTVLGRVVDRTGFWFIVTLAAELVIGYANTPPAVARTVHFCWVIVFAVQAALWARALILGLIEHRAGVADADHSALGSAMGIIRLLVSFGLFALATILILDNLGVNVTGLIAGLGIGGIAIGLAAKGIFDDLFAALAILFDRPFKQGDSVRWDQTSGTVEAIGLKTTRVRSINGEQVIISNANLLNKELHNLARLDRRRLSIVVGVVYELPAETLRAIPGMMTAIVGQVDKCGVVRCGLIRLGESSIDFEVQFDVRSEVYNEVYDAQTEVHLGIVERFAAEGIAIAYPTRTTYMAAPDGQPVVPHADHRHDEARDANVA